MDGQKLDWGKFSLEKINSDDNLPLLFQHACPCGVEKAGRWDFGPRWTCACGREFYVDPAGRLWGPEALANLEG